MPVKLTIAARDLPDGAHMKGDIVAIMHDSRDWGAKEVPPDFVRVVITDVTPFQAAHWARKWHPRFRFAIDAQNSAGWRITIAVHPDDIDAGNRARNLIRAEMADYLAADPFNASVVSATAASATIDVPKPQWMNARELAEFLDRLRDRFNSHWAETFAVRRWRVAPAAVDTLAALPDGFREASIAEVRANIQDKLDDQ